jgi:hypothetical protein
MHLLLDLPVTPPLAGDFGIRSADHYRALKTALFAAQEDIEAAVEDADGAEAASLSGLRKRILALDAAYGQGARLTAFVREYAPLYAERVSFRTVWDALFGRSDADPA